MKYELSNMMCLDVYLSHLSLEEHQNIKELVRPSTLKPLPLASWDLFMEHTHHRGARSSKKVEVNQVLSMAQKYHWKNDVQSILNEHEFDALIITDASQKIIWVNDGFSTMTGYSKKFAINKHPNFLQGAKTTSRSKQLFKKKIKRDQPFKEVIVNYRKDKTVYNCEVVIIPLYHNTTTHYLALERKVG
ncbi:MAG: PAS domain-containing protein [Bacteroidetes bacterium]|nr:PAS domain-containing protein [Bacteroidota bacterium]